MLLVPCQSNLPSVRKPAAGEPWKGPLPNPPWNIICCKLFIAKLWKNLPQNSWPECSQNPQLAQDDEQTGQSPIMGALQEEGATSLLSPMKTDLAGGGREDKWFCTEETKNLRSTQSGGILHFSFCAACWLPVPLLPFFTSAFLSFLFCSFLQEIKDVAEIMPWPAVWSRRSEVLMQGMLSDDYRKATEISDQENVKSCVCVCVCVY